MASAKKQVTFAVHSLEAFKQQIAAEIRKQITQSHMKYEFATEIFGVSMSAISRIMNYKEQDMSFELLHNAAISAGIVISMQLEAPK